MDTRDNAALSESAFPDHWHADRFARGHEGDQSNGQIQAEAGDLRSGGKTGQRASCCEIRGVLCANSAGSEERLRRGS